MKVCFVNYHGNQIIYYYLFAAGTVSYQKEDERVSFDFPQEISSSEATLNIDFTGILNDQMKGFYRSKYTRPDEPDVEKYTAVTQFEVREKGGEKRRENEQTSVIVILYNCYYNLKLGNYIVVILYPAPSCLLVTICLLFL